MGLVVLLLALMSPIIAPIMAIDGMHDFFMNAFGFSIAPAADQMLKALESIGDGFLSVLSFLHLVG